MQYGETLYILDEATTGLHPSNVDLLTTQRDGLVVNGDSVIVVHCDAPYRGVTFTTLARQDRTPSQASGRRSFVRQISIAVSRLLPQLRAKLPGGYPGFAAANRDSRSSGVTLLASLPAPMFAGSFTAAYAL
jgi:hypothetical protein